MTEQDAAAKLAEEIAEVLVPDDDPIISRDSLAYMRHQTRDRILPRLTAALDAMRQERDRLLADARLYVEQRDQARAEVERQGQARDAAVRVGDAAQAEASRLSEMLDEARFYLSQALQILEAAGEMLAERGHPAMADAAKFNGRLRAFLAKPPAAAVEPPSVTQCDGECGNAEMHRAAPPIEETEDLKARLHPAHELPEPPIEETGKAILGERHEFMDKAPLGPPDNPLWCHYVVRTGKDPIVCGKPASDEIHAVDMQVFTFGASAPVHQAAEHLVPGDCVRPEDCVGVVHRMRPAPLPRESAEPAEPGKNCSGGTHRAPCWLAAKSE